MGSARDHEKARQQITLAKNSFDKVRSGKKKIQKHLAGPDNFYNTMYGSDNPYSYVRGKSCRQHKVRIAPCYDILQTVRRTSRNTNILIVCEI